MVDKNRMFFANGDLQIWVQTKIYLWPHMSLCIKRSLNIEYIDTILKQYFVIVIW